MPRVIRIHAVLWLALSFVCASYAIRPIASSSSPNALNAQPLQNGGLFVLGDPIRIRVAQRPSWVRYRLTDAYGPADWTVNGEVFEGEGQVQSDSSGA
ncbi:MAG: hypothetical protein RMK32_06455 [Anaerolineae bacterium]|nr:hypothetical protein [Thermoflexus sp.]MDW8065255.1 hypothetical protein [Anaerolineae bacterium]